MDDNLVKIKNLNRMAKHIGRDVAMSLSMPLSEFKEYITPKEVKSLIKQYSIYQDDKFMINGLILQKIFTEVNNWVLGINLCKMAVAGQIETSWDSEQNCMLFDKN
jgi:hypothetical protein